MVVERIGYELINGYIFRKYSTTIYKRLLVRDPMLTQRQFPCPILSPFIPAIGSRGVLSLLVTTVFGGKGREVDGVRDFNYGW